MSDTLQGLPEEYKLRYGIAGKNFSFYLGALLVNNTLVCAVRTGTLAEQFHLAQGDILTRIDDQPVKTVNEVKAYITTHTGQKVTLTVTRAGAECQLSCVLPPALPAASGLTPIGYD